jgi:hypothetical protein
MHAREDALEYPGISRVTRSLYSLIKSKLVHFELKAQVEKHLLGLELGKRKS